MFAHAAAQKRGLASRLVLGLVAAAAALAAVGWLLFLLRYRHSHNIAARGLFPDGAVSLDLTTYIRRFDVFRTRDFFEPADPELRMSRFAYPPAAVFCYWALYHSHHMKFAYNVLSVGMWLSLLAVAGVAVWRATRAILAVVVAVLCFVPLSYPALFLFERGNIEVFLWLLLVAAVLFYLSGRRHAAAVCLGIAAAVKLYPILLLGIFVGRRRDWGAILTGLVTTVLVTVSAIAISAPGFFRLGAHGFLEGITGFQDKYASSLHAGPSAFDHSAFSWVKFAALDAGRSPQSFTKAYYLACGLVAAVVFLVWVRRRPFLNRLAFLTVAMILLPPVSFEYTLVHLYLVAGLLLFTLLRERSRGEKPAPSAWAALVCVLVLLMPVDLLGSLAAFAGQVQVVPLLVLMVAAAVQPWTSSEERLVRDHSGVSDRAPSAAALGL